MIHELSARKIEFVKPFFRGKQFDMIISSIAEGNNEARLWMDNGTSAQLAFLWDKGNNVFYFGGESGDPQFLKDISKRVRQEIRNCAIDENCPHFQVYEHGEIFKGRAIEIFKDYDLSQIRKVFYESDGTKLMAEPDKIENEVTIVPIDRSLLHASGIRNVEFIRQEVEWMWSSIDRYYEKGFGFAAIDTDKAICWCTAEYVSKEMCGIGIETLADYQNQGIATATATVFVRYCFENNIIPHWECDVENRASVRVAEKVGFHKVEQAIFYEGKFQ